jgi:hypothetical protein
MLQWSLSISNPVPIHGAEFDSKQNEMLGPKEKRKNNGK